MEKRFLNNKYTCQLITGFMQQVKCWNINDAVPHLRLVAMIEKEKGKVKTPFLGPNWTMYIALTFP